MPPPQSLTGEDSGRFSAIDAKSEILSTKSETNSNDENSKSKTNCNILISQQL